MNRFLILATCTFTFMLEHILVKARTPDPTCANGQLRENTAGEKNYCTSSTCEFGSGGSCGQLTGYCCLWEDFEKPGAIGDRSCDYHEAPCRTSNNNYGICWVTSKAGSVDGSGKVYDLCSENGDFSQEIEYIDWYDSSEGVYKVRVCAYPDAACEATRISGCGKNCPSPWKQAGRRFDVGCTWPFCWSGCSDPPICVRGCKSWKCNNLDRGF
eukprot:1024040_1